MAELLRFVSLFFGSLFFHRNTIFSTCYIVGLVETAHYLHGWGERMGGCACVCMCVSVNEPLPPPV